MPKKSILYIITKSVWGGAARYIFDLATHLPKEQFKVAVAAGESDKLAQKIKKGNIPYFEINNFQRRINPFKELLAGFEILSLLFGLRPNIVHVNSSKAGGVAGLAAWLYKLITRRKLQIIFTAHGWAFAEDKPKWQLCLIKFISKITALFYNKIICVSEFDYHIAIKNKIAPAHKLTTIHNGIDVAEIKLLPKQDAREKLLSHYSQLTTHHFIIGTIAEWTKNKGITFLLEAITKIKKHHLDLILIGGGENPDKGKILDFIKKNRLKNIHLHENLEQAASYLKAFDIFVLPSTKEGLPYTILEAMAAGLPIIATNVGGIPELITNSQNGFLIEPKNPQALAEKIKLLIEDKNLREKFSKSSQNRIQNFTLERMIKSTKKIYQEK